MSDSNSVDGKINWELSFYNLMAEHKSLQAKADAIQAELDTTKESLQAAQSAANKLAEALERNIECAKMGHDVPNKYLFAIATDLERALAEYRGENK